MTKKITRSQLLCVVKDYHKLLPEWTLIPKDPSLVRIDGPVTQIIGWESLSWGVYRPGNSVQVLAQPKGAIFFPAFPGGRPRTLSLQEHKEYPKGVLQMVETMKKEFRPSMTKPLCAEHVLELAEAEAYPTSLQAYGLAALNAYFGHDDRALHLCRQFDSLVNERTCGRPWAEWETEQREFLDSLESWVKEGTARAHLEEIIKEQRQKLGLPTGLTP